MLNQQYRRRIDGINQLVNSHRGEDERGQYAVTPYKLLKSGFVSVEYNDEFERIVDNLPLNNYSDSPATIVELLSYSNYFTFNPEKVCGEMIASTSGGFPVKVKGKREDVEAAIDATLKGKQEAVFTEIETDWSDYKLDIWAFDSRYNGQIKIAIDFKDYENKSKTLKETRELTVDDFRIVVYPNNSRIGNVLGNSEINKKFIGFSEFMNIVVAECSKKLNEVSASEKEQARRRRIRIMNMNLSLYAYSQKNEQ